MKTIKINPEIDLDKSDVRELSMLPARLHLILINVLTAESTGAALLADSELKDVHDQSSRLLYFVNMLHSMDKQRSDDYGFNDDFVELTEFLAGIGRCCAEMRGLVKDTDTRQAVYSVDHVAFPSGSASK